jgi:hypothetical protein
MVEFLPELTQRAPKTLQHNIRDIFRRKHVLTLLDRTVNIMTRTLLYVPRGGQCAQTVQTPSWLSHQLVQYPKINHSSGFSSQQRVDPSGRASVP